MEDEKLMKKNRLFILFIFFLAMSITLVSLLTATFVRDRYIINIGSVSPKKFKAPQNIVNEVATEKLKVSVANSVTKLYRTDSEITDRINQDIDIFIDEIIFFAS